MTTIYEHVGSSISPYCTISQFKRNAPFGSNTGPLSPAHVLFITSTQEQLNNSFATYMEQAAYYCFEEAQERMPLGNNAEQHALASTLVFKKATKAKRDIAKTSPLTEVFVCDQFGKYTRGAPLFVVKGTNTAALALAMLEEGANGYSV